MSSTASEAVTPGTKVLLVVDDDDFRQRTAELLRGEGYSCFEARASDQARLVLEAEQDIAAVLSDGGLLGELTVDFPDLVAVPITVAELGDLVTNLAAALAKRDLEAAKRDQVEELEGAIGRTRILGGVLAGLEGGTGALSEGDEEMIERLSRAISLRDEETGRHIQRMSRYAAVVAEAVGFTRIGPDDLRLAAALHDVGKIGVPDAILLKPGSLSRHEMRAMERHPRIGYQLLAGSTSALLRTAADIALTHHEWWDGSGYPRGLRGEEIPEEARIAAVADVFDALTSNRVYRAAMSFDDAIALMRASRGRQFEPRLLDGLLGSMDRIGMIRAAYPDIDDAPERIRILVVDDHEIFAHSLVRLLDGTPQIKVVGTAGTVAAAVAAAVAYAPDVILMDFELPDGHGAAATLQIKALTPAVKVIMLTARTDDEALVRAIAAGCSGFVRKEDAVEDLLRAIVAAHEGETIIPPVDLAPLLQLLPPTRRGLGADLTPRELEVLVLSAGGLVNKQIAQRLGLRLNTVRNHVQKILYKLQAHSKLEAVATAVREGVIDYPDGSGQVAGTGS
jgi:putative two-component system response regulator